MRARISAAVVSACAAAATLTAAAPPAQACSCVGTRVIPEASEPVPQNVVFAVRTQAAWAQSVTLREADSLDPVAAETDLTELHADQVLVLLTPSAPLAAGGRYELSVEATGQTAGIYTITEGAAKAALAAPTITDLEAEADDAEVSSAECKAMPGGYFGTLRLALDAAPANTAHALLQLRAGDAEPVQVPISRSLDGDRTLELHTGVCDPLPAIVPGQRYCAQLTVYDLAGNSAIGNEECTTADERGCAAGGPSSTAAALALLGLLATAARRRRG